MIFRVDDDLKRSLTFGAAPKRVVSLVPSDTYSLVVLGAAGALVGRTDYCAMPDDVASVAHVPSLGGTKNPDVARILALEPDLVVANQEENTKKDLEKLAQAGVKVLVSFPRRAADGLAHFARLARIFRVEREPAIRALVKRGYEAVREPEGIRPLRVFCPIWMKPLMTINGATFMSDVLRLAGAENVFADRARRYPLAADVGIAAPVDAEGRDTRYPRVTLEEVLDRQPELVLLPDEPHPFTQEDAAVFENAGLRAHFISGKDLCWYGARTIDGLARVRAAVDAQRT